MILLRSAVFFVTMAMVGCGSVDHGDVPPTGARRYTLTSSVGASEGLVLATGEKLQDGAIGDADIVLHLSKVMSLGGAGSEPPFCPRGDGFEDVAEVPADASDCAWSNVTLAPNAPGGSRLVARDGYLTRDRGSALYRLLLIEHVVGDGSDGSGNIGSATFDVLPVD
jgi:hypothetical protein